MNNITTYFTKLSTHCDVEASRLLDEDLNILCTFFENKENIENIENIENQELFLRIDNRIQYYISKFTLKKEDYEDIKSEEQYLFLNKLEGYIERYSSRKNPLNKIKIFYNLSKKIAKGLDKGLIVRGHC